MPHKDQTKRRDYQKEYHQALRRNKPGVLAARVRAWNMKNPEKRTAIHFRSRLRRKYKMTEVEYSLLLSAQGGGCAICGGKKAASSGGQCLVVDYDHKTGKGRGILCGNCNMMLGGARDNKDFLGGAILYLQPHTADDSRVGVKIAKPDETFAHIAAPV